MGIGASILIDWSGQKIVDAMRRPVVHGFASPLITDAHMYHVRITYGQVDAVEGDQDAMVGFEPSIDLLDERGGQ